MNPLVAGIELGGTKCACILATGPDDIRAEVRIGTRRPDETLGAIRAVLSRWHAEHPFSALGLASFGPLDLDPASRGYGSILGTPKRAWDHVSLLSWAQQFGVAVSLDTDVNAAARGEGRWGAARGLRSFVYVTVGTGVGVGSINDGRVLRGLGHSEAGHMRVPRLPGATWRGACPYHGDCVEGLACGRAIESRTGRRASELPDDDPVWNEVAHALAALFHNLVLSVVPERILVGGGVMNPRPQLLARTRRALVESLGGYGFASQIARQIETFVVPPQLGERAGSLGAIALAHDALQEPHRRS